MAAGRIVVPPYFPARNRDFDLLSGAKLYVYDNLTTDKANIYTDEALTVLSANPVIANSSGQFPAIWAQAGTEAEPVLYSVAVTTSTGASPGNPFVFDNYRPSVDWAIVGDAEAARDAALAAQTGAETAQGLSEDARDDAAASAASAAAITGGTPSVTKSVMKALNTATVTQAYLMGPAGQEGMFAWDATVSQNRHLKDTAELDLIAPDANDNGAWVRAVPYGKRDLKALASQLQGPVGGQLVLEKLLASGGEEYAVYEQMGAFSPYFRRTHMSNFLNTDNGVGDVRQINTSIATLFVKTAHAQPGTNELAVTLQDDNADVVKVTSDGTETGTFSTSVLNSLTFRPSETIGDKVVYTITGVARIACRSYATSNGGLGKVTVKTGGTEIASDLYVLPVDRIISFRGTGYHVTHQLASGLNPASTYEVTIEVDASNPSGGQLWQAGLLGYDATWKTRTGLIGTHIAETTVGRDCILSAGVRNPSDSSQRANPGNTWVRQVTDTTRIMWRSIFGPLGGIAQFDVYDADGVLVHTSTLDTYSAGYGLIDHVVVVGLPAATYYVHVISTGTKHASSAGYDVFHFEIEGSNESKCASLLSQEFDLGDVPRLATSVTYGTDSLSSYGNIEVAIAVRKVGEAEGLGAFIGGIHGRESDAAARVFEVDGVAIDYAGAAQYDRWVANHSVEVTATGHKYRFPTDATFANPCMTADYVRTWFGAGMYWSWTPTVLREIVSDVNYAFMAMSAEAFTKHVASPRGDWTLSGTADEIVIPRTPDAVGWYNNEHMVISWPIDLDEHLAVFDALGFNSTPGRFAFLADWVDPRGKYYFKSFSNSAVTIPVSKTWTQQGFLTAYRTRDMARLMAQTAV